MQAMNVEFQKLASAEEVENYAKQQEQIFSDEAAGKIRQLKKSSAEPGKANA